MSTCIKAMQQNQ